MLAIRHVLLRAAAKNFSISKSLISESSDVSWKCRAAISFIALGNLHFIAVINSVKLVISLPFSDWFISIKFSWVLIKLLYFYLNDFAISPSRAFAILAPSMNFILISASKASLEEEHEDDVDENSFIWIKLGRQTSARAQQEDSDFDSSGGRRETWKHFKAKCEIYGNPPTAITHSMTCFVLFCSHYAPWQGKESHDTFAVKLFPFSKPRRGKLSPFLTNVNLMIYWVWI